MSIENQERGPTGTRTWLWWVVVSALAVVTAAVLFAIQIFILIKYGNSQCHEPVPVTSRRAGETWLIITSTIATTLWLVGTWVGTPLGTGRGRRFAFMLGCTVLATAPGWLYVIYGLAPAHWSNGLCF